MQAKKNSKLFSIFKLLTLCILPFILLITGFYLRKELLYYHLTSVDPEFAYLFNALNITHLQFPWHIDHPGTPLQCMSAVLFRIIYFIRHPQMSIDYDVFANPEIYLKSVITSLYLLDSISLFILGYFSYKISGKFLTGLFLQISPFCSFMVISLLNRIIVEHLMIPITLILILMVFAYLQIKKIDFKIQSCLYLNFFNINRFGYGTLKSPIPRFSFCP